MEAFPSGHCTVCDPVCIEYVACLKPLKDGCRLWLLIWPDATCAYRTYMRTAIASGTQRHGHQAATMRVVFVLYRLLRCRVMLLHVHFTAVAICVIIAQQRCGHCAAAGLMAFSGFATPRQCGLKSRPGRCLAPLLKKNGATWPAVCGPCQPPPRLKSGIAGFF